MDSKFQCRDASPAPKAWAPSFGGESQLLKSPKRLYRLAESDDSSDYTTAPTVDRPQFDRSLECARNRKFEFSFFQERFMRTFGFPSGNPSRSPEHLAQRQIALDADRRYRAADFGRSANLPAAPGGVSALPKVSPG